MNKVTIPKKLQPIVLSFFAQSEDEAKALIVQATKSIYEVEKDDNSFFQKRLYGITKKELQGVYALMQGIKPQDLLEALFSAQVVVSYMLGMRKINGGSNDLRLGLNLMKFSNEALYQLNKKKSGDMQSITVEFNVTDTYSER